MAIKRWNASTSQWELVGTPGTASPSAIGAAGLVGGNTLTGRQTVSGGAGAIDIEAASIIRAKNGYRITGNNGVNEYQIGPFYNFTDFQITHSTDNFANHAKRFEINTTGSSILGALSASTFNPDSSFNKTFSVHQGDQVITLGSYWQAGVGQNSYINSSQGTSRTNASNLFLQTGGLNRLLIETNGNIQMVNNGVDTLRYFDIYNTNSGNSAGTIIRLITNNAANSAVTTVDMVKYRNGYFGILNNDASAVIGFGTGGTERMRISSAGQVGVGTDNPQARVHSIAASGGSPLLLGMVSSDTTSWIQPKVQRNGFGQQAAWLYTPSTVDSNNPVWYTGLNASRANFTFSTFDAVNFTERVHITPVGYMLIGYSTSNGAYNLQVNSQIFATSSSIATSDGRYKENVLPITSGLDIIDSLNPVSFDWKEHPVHNFVPGKTVGFIAQEVKEALSDYEWVDNIIKTNTTEAVLDEDGNEITPAEEFLGIAESNIIPLLVAAVKELRAEVNTLKAQLSN
jgi:hypothetical protein